MQLKDDSVNPIGLRSELLFGIMAAQEVYREYGYDLVITSLNDAKHSSTSLHYSGSAVDLRTVVLNPEEDWESVAIDIKQRLNINYDVINESNHIHLEYQPRG